MTSKALFLSGPKTLKIEERPQPPPRPNELQLAILGTTLCGSDLHYYNSYRNGFIIPKHPMILGHEACGKVIAIGSDATGWEIGDLVALEVGVPCGKCRVCGQGRYNICPGMRFRSSAKYPTAGDYEEADTREALEGTLQTVLNHKVEWCHKLPKDFSVPMACLLEPIAVAIHATSRVPITKDTKVLVLGSGPIGVLVAHAAKARGGTTSIADVNMDRINFATGNGLVSNYYKLSLGLTPKDAAELITTNLGKIVSPDGFDVVFECSGVPAVINTAIYSAAAGGSVVVLGIPPASVELDLAAATLREVSIVGSFRYAHDYKSAIDLACKGELEALVTHTVHGLEEVEKGFEIMQGKELAMKVFVSME